MTGFGIHKRYAKIDSKISLDSLNPVEPNATLPALTQTQEKIVAAYAKTLSHLWLPGSQISFQRALVAKERSSRNNAEIHLDYVVSSAGYWPLWAEKSQFASKIFQSWITARTMGRLGGAWICLNTKKGYLKAELEILNEIYELSLRDNILKSPLVIMTAVIPEEPGHQLFNSPDVLISSLLDSRLPAPIVVLKSDIPYIERWRSVRYVTTVLPEPLSKILKSSAVTNYSQYAEEVDLDELSKNLDSTALSTLIYLSTSLVENDKNLGAKIAEKLAKTFTDLITVKPSESHSSETDTAMAGLNKKSSYSGGGKIVITATESQKRTLAAAFPNRPDPIDYLVGLTQGFPSYSTALSNPNSAEELFVYTIKFSYFGEGWWGDLLKILTPLAEAEISVVGVFLLPDNGVRTINSQNNEIRIFNSSHSNIPESLSAEIADLSLWTQAYDMQPLPPGKIEY